MEKTTLYLPEELQARLRETSKRTGKPQAALIRDAITRYLDADPRPWPSSVGAFPGLLAGATPRQAKRRAREGMAARKPARRRRADA